MSTTGIFSQEKTATYNVACLIWSVAQEPNY